MHLRTIFRALAPILGALAAWQPSLAADIGKRTAIVCISQDSKSLVSVPGSAGDTNSEKVIASFTQWMFEAEKELPPSEIRFLWIPHTPTSAPELKISTTDTNHSVIRVLSQTRHGVLAATSASARMTNIGWMFAINFKAERVISTQVFSNLGGGRGGAFSYSCRFDSQVPSDERSIAEDE